MTYAKQTWTDNTTPVDAAHMNHIENGIAAVEAEIPIAVQAVPGYGTVLPASPVDGQQYILVDSVTSPTYQWLFRYNAGSTSANKWEFVGGSPFKAIGPTNTSLTSPNTWYQIFSFAVPRAGDYLCEGVVGCNSQASSGTHNIYATINSTPANGTIAPGELVGSGLTGRVSMTVKDVRSLAASVAVSLYAMSTLATPSPDIAEASFFSVLPIRVA